MRTPPARQWTSITDSEVQQRRLFAWIGQPWRFWGYKTRSACSDNLSLLSRSRAILAIISAPQTSATIVEDYFPLAASGIVLSEAVSMVVFLKGARHAPLLVPSRRSISPTGYLDKITQHKMKPHIRTSGARVRNASRMERPVGCTAKNLRRTLRSGGRRPANTLATVASTKAACPITSCNLIKPKFKARLIRKPIRNRVS